MNNYSEASCKNGDEQQPVRVSEEIKFFRCHAQHISESSSVIHGFVSEDEGKL